MVKNEMTEDRKEALKILMAWYWQDGLNHISKSDYEFLYDLYDHSLSFYNEDVQNRLNQIRKVYITFNDNDNSKKNL
jgi:hypothetical protein